jgi:ATP-dependent Clp protease ATP-binding subunit ClpC
VTYDDAAIEATVTLAERYLTDRKFPDKAIDLLDEAAASVVAARRNRDVLERLRTLELAHGETVAAKDAAVKAEKMAEAASYRSEEMKLEDQRIALENELTARRNATPLIVRTEDVAAVVARIANIPLATVLATERERMRDIAVRLKERIVGQDTAVDLVADAIRKARLGLGDARRPKASFLFAGPSGIGKTELARALAGELFGREDALVKIDMSEFAEGYGASKLLGSPAGYVGYRDGNAFTDAIRKKPHCVVCFDEVEKAHADVLNLLLQILDDGKVTDATGRPVSFRHTYVVLTSNVGAETIGQKSLGFGNDERNLGDLIRRDIAERFRPELLNRLDHVIVFNPLGKNELRHIVKRELDDAIARASSAQRIACEAGDDVIDWLLSQPMPEKEGARAARRIVEREVTNLIARLLSEKPLKRTIKLRATKQGLRAM